MQSACSRDLERSVKTSGRPIFEMSPAKSKRARKNQDKHRWRKVLVWIIPLLFGVFLTLAIGTHRKQALWCWVLCILTFLSYTLFLLEWYVWREGNLARKIARTSFAIIAISFVLGGFYWQRRFPNDVSDERPYVWTKEINFSGFVVGEHPAFQVVFENAGKAAALNLRGQIVVYTAPPPLPEPLAFENKPYESLLFIPANGSANQVFIDKDFVAYERFIQQVNNEQAVVYVYGKVEYDSPNGVPHVLTYCSFWNPSKKSFTACAKHNQTT